MTFRSVIQSEYAWFATCVLYIGSITLLRESPYMPYEAAFNAPQAALWAAIALGGGVLVGSPRSLALGVFLAALGPMHTVTIGVTIAAIMWILLRQLRHRDATWHVSLPAIARSPFLWLYVLIGYLTLLWVARLGGGTDVWSWPLLLAGMFAVPVLWSLFAGFTWTSDDLVWIVRRGTLAVLALLSVVLAYPLFFGSSAMYLYAIAAYHKVLPFIGLHLQKYALPFSQQPFDFNWGSMASAHYASVLFGLLALGMALHAILARTRASWMWCVLAAGGWIITENLHSIPGFAAGLVIILATMLPRRRMPAPALTAAAAAMAIALPVALAYHFYAGGAPMEHSRKGVLIYDTWSEMKTRPVRAFFGAGPGTFGSKTADMRLPLKYREIGSNLPQSLDRVSPDYERTLQAVSRIPSYIPPLHVPLFSTMGRTMSGAVGILREFGLLGTALLGIGLVIFLLRAFTASRASTPAELRVACLLAAVFPVLLACLSVFRHYPEYPDIMTAGMLPVMIVCVVSKGEYSDAKYARYGD